VSGIISHIQKFDPDVMAGTGQKPETPFIQRITDHALNIINRL
jgi:hypothetical protein